jgi:hypothetical protein
VTTTPAGARVLVDGASAGQTPLDRFALAAGKRVAMDVVLDGYKPVHQDVIGQGPQTFGFALEKLQVTPPPVPEVVLKLVSQPPGATVSLGDTVLGTTPLDQKLPRSDAELTFTFKLAGHKPEKRSVTATADAEVKATLVRLGGAASKPPPHDDLGIKTGR